MSAVAFDTLTAARDLEAAGIERRQAEAIAGTVRTAAAERDALATKADLAELRADMAEHRADTKADLAELRADMAELASKADLAALRADTKAEIAALRADTKADLRAELVTIRWAAGLTVAFMFAIGLRVFGLI